MILLVFWHVDILRLALLILFVHKKKRHTWQQQLLQKIIFFNTLYLVKVQLNFFILSIRVWSGKLIFHWLTLPKEKSPSMRDKNQKLWTSDSRGRCGDLWSCELRTKKKNAEKKKVLNTIWAVCLGGQRFRPGNFDCLIWSFDLLRKKMTGKVFSPLGGPLALAQGERFCFCAANQSYKLFLSFRTWVTKQRVLGWTESVTNRLIDNMLGVPPTHTLELAHTSAPTHTLS